MTGIVQRETRSGVGNVVDVQQREHLKKAVQLEIEHVVVGQGDGLNAGAVQAGDMDRIAAEVEHLPRLSGSGTPGFGSAGQHALQVADAPVRCLEQRQGIAPHLFVRGVGATVGPHPAQLTAPRHSSLMTSFMPAGATGLRARRATICTMTETGPNAVASSLMERMLAGDLRALARAITLVENRAPAAEALLRAAFPHSGEAQVIGLTGAPGSGKSTLVDQLARSFRSGNESVGVVAVDPSSPFTGGAILGDRIRMQSQPADAGIFIRSLATRGALGGLSRAARDVVTLMAAAGRRRILVETVGVGQDEVDIVKLADVTLVVLVPGMGDEVQALKAGMMEIADVFVLNKADRGADRLEQEVRGMLALLPRDPDAWRPPLVRTVATEGKGIDEVRSAIDARLQWVEAHGGLAAHRRRHWVETLQEMLRDALYEHLLAPRMDAATLVRLTEKIAAREQDPYSAVQEILDGILKHCPSGAEPG